MSPGAFSSTRTHALDLRFQKTLEDLLVVQPVPEQAFGDADHAKHELGRHERDTRQCNHQGKHAMVDAD